MTPRAGPSPITARRMAVMPRPGAESGGVGGWRCHAPGQLEIRDRGRRRGSCRSRNARREIRSHRMIDSLVVPAPFTPGGGPGSPIQDAARIARLDLTREYVASGASYHSATVPLALPASIDDVMRERGALHYDWMMTDPVVS